MAVLRDDPYAAFNFLVDLGTGEHGGTGRRLPGVLGASAWRCRTPSIANGNHPENNALKIPGLTKVLDVTLRRGLIGSLTSIGGWTPSVTASRARCGRSTIHAHERGPHGGRDDVGAAARTDRQARQRPVQRAREQTSRWRSHARLRAARDRVGTRWTIPSRPTTSGSKSSWPGAPSRCAARRSPSARGSSCAWTSAACARAATRGPVLLAGPASYGEVTLRRGMTRVLRPLGLVRGGPARPVVRADAADHAGARPPRACARAFGCAGACPFACGPRDWTPSTAPWRSRSSGWPARRWRTSARTATHPLRPPPRARPSCASSTRLASETNPDAPCRSSSTRRACALTTGPTERRRRLALELWFDVSRRARRGRRAAPHRPVAYFAGARTGPRDPCAFSGARSASTARRVPRGVARLFSPDGRPLRRGSPSPCARRADREPPRSAGIWSTVRGARTAPISIKPCAASSWSSTRAKAVGDRKNANDIHQGRLPRWPSTLGRAPGAAGFGRDRAAGPGPAHRLMKGPQRVHMGKTHIIIMWTVGAEDVAEGTASSRATASG